MEDSVSIGFVDNLILFRAMKKFWKSVKIWQSYGREYVAYFFLAHPVDNSRQWTTELTCVWSNKIWRQTAMNDCNTCSTGTEWQEMNCLFVRSLTRLFESFYRTAWNADAVLRWDFCLSVCQTRALWQNGRKISPDFYTLWKIIQSTFMRRRMVGGGRPLLSEMLVNRPALEWNRRF